VVVVVTGGGGGGACDQPGVAKPSASAKATIAFARRRRIRPCP